MKKLNLYLINLLLIFSPFANAGYFEIGGSGSYRTSTVNEFTYSKTQSLTGSLAYYFWELSALEFNYTDGLSKSYGRTATSEDYIYTTRFSLTGIDLILSFAGRQAPFRPYIKLGGAYQKKVTTYEQGIFDARTERSEGWSATAGGGVRIMFTDQFALKLGFDSWTTPLNEEPVKYDFAATGGISWMF